MNENQSSLETLKEIAKRTGREAVSSEIPYPSAAIHKVTYHRRTLYFPNNSYENSYFVCFADSKEFGNHAVFSGVFFPIDIGSSTHMVIKNKDILDKINLFGKKKFLKTGIPSYDSRVLIKGNDAVAVKRLFGEKRMKNLIDHTLKLHPGIIVAINDADVNFVPGLKGKSNLGIFITREWIMEVDLIEKLFIIAEQFMLEP